MTTAAQTLSGFSQAVVDLTVPRDNVGPSDCTSAWLKPDRSHTGITRLRQGTSACLPVSGRYVGYVQVVKKLISKQSEGVHGRIMRPEVVNICTFLTWHALTKH